MITIVDYKTGNIESVKNALKRLGCEFTLSAEESVLRSSDKVILPGVGEAITAMASLRERGLDRIIPSLEMPVMGICLGMQIMCSHSQEGDVDCLSIFPNRVLSLDAPNLKVPHIGWNSIEDLRSPIYSGFTGGEYVYYVHSFGAEVDNNTVATTTYGTKFSASLGRDNFYGCQFHPEKSGEVGERILRNFLAL